MTAEAEIPTDVDAEVSERPQPVHGFDEAFMAAATDVTEDVDDLTVGGLSDIHCTLIGMGWIPGGEEQIGDDGKPYITKDTMLWTWRLDNPDDIGWTSEDLEVNQYIRMPNISKRTGTRVRATQTSGWGLILRHLAQLGIATNKEHAFTYHLDPDQKPQIKDLLGIMVHRQKREFPFSDRPNARPLAVDVPIEVYGFDNDVRKSLKLKPVNLDAPVSME